MTVETARPILPGFNPFDPDFLRDPFPTWSRAQEECPVFYFPEMNYWVISRFDDILAAVTDWQTFSSDAVDVIPPPADIAADLPPNFFRPSLVANDPPAHTGPRKAINPGFTRPKVAAMEPAVIEIANDLIDQFVDRGHCDLMQEFCYPLSLRTIVRMFGLPDGEENLTDYRTWTQDLFAMLIPKTEAAASHPMPTEEVRERWESMRRAVRFYQQLIDKRREEPCEDLLTAMIEARREDGSPVMDDGEIILHIIEITAAGNDTTANLIGSFVLYLSEQPEDFREVKGNPDLLENAVEELLRRRGSSVGMFRLTTRDVTVAGVDIPKRELVFLPFQAGGHDQSHFPKPRHVDVRRENADDHISFGRGRHFCMGAPLARMEAREALRILFERIPEIEAVPDQPLEYPPNMTVSMLTSLQTRW